MKILKFGMLSKPLTGHSNPMIQNKKENPPHGANETPCGGTGRTIMGSGLMQYISQKRHGSQICGPQVCEPRIICLSLSVK